MKKDLQRAALAAIIGALAVMTGCDQSDNSNMKGRGMSGETGNMKQGMDQDDQSAKPMPNDRQNQMPSQNGDPSYGGQGYQNQGNSQHHYCD